ncbi:hypothetical protein BDQ17DRAFT_1313222 [Cyathus striatus]|nr:hypothetical protein BDQ17DRAFT_1313222 [Cyathus striatus]
MDSNFVGVVAQQGSLGLFGPRSESLWDSFNKLPLYTNSPSLTPDFTGQEAYLQRLHQHFELNCSSKDSIPERKLFLLYGADGIGKTQICLKFMNQMANQWVSFSYDTTKLFTPDRFSATYWIDATSEQTMARSFGDNRPHLISDFNEVAAQLRLTNWLLVFDNASESPEDIEEFFPPGNSGCILITSRSSTLISKVVLPENAIEVTERTEPSDRKRSCSLVLLLVHFRISQSINPC